MAVAVGVLAVARLGRTVVEARARVVAVGARVARVDGVAVAVEVERARSVASPPLSREQQAQLAADARPPHDAAVPRRLILARAVDAHRAARVDRHRVVDLLHRLDRERVAST